MWLIWDEFGGFLCIGSKNFYASQKNIAIFTARSLGHVALWCEAIITKLGR
jgi:hypothetical protein